jgi:hypothetical protein
VHSLVQINKYKKYFFLLAFVRSVNDSASRNRKISQV